MMQGFKLLWVFYFFVSAVSGSVAIPAFAS